MHKYDNNLMSILAAEALLCENKKNPVKNVAPSRNRTQASHNLWFQVQHSPFRNKLTFAYKTETSGSLYSYALLIKNQVVYKQNFKDLLSSTFQVSPERIVLDLESEVMRGPGSIPTGFHRFFCFHVVKPLMPILALFPILFNYEKLRVKDHISE